MRKLIALMMSLSVVMASSIPLVPMASACTPAYQATKQVQDNMQPPSVQAFALPVDGHMKSAQACIECACGCHAGIDSLPNLLAPCVPCDPGSVQAELHDVPIVLHVPGLLQLQPGLAVPPPRNV